MDQYFGTKATRAPRAIMSLCSIYEQKKNKTPNLLSMESIFASTAAAFCHPDQWSGRKTQIGHLQTNEIQIERCVFSIEKKLNATAVE